METEEIIRQLRKIAEPTSLVVEVGYARRVLIAAADRLEAMSAELSAWGY